MRVLGIAWHLSLYQHFWCALKQSSALLVKIQWPAQEDCNGAMCFPYQGAGLYESSHFAAGAPGASVSCIRDLESCSASTVFQRLSGLFSTCCGSLLFGLQSPQPKSNIGEQALQLCHRLCMIFRNVEIAIMGRLVHGNQSVKSSPEHGGIRHLHPHTVHS